MAIDTSDFKNGMAFYMDGVVHQITEFQHVKPGKGGAFVRTRLRNLKTGATYEKTFRSGERFEPAFLEKVEYQFLFKSGDELTLMDMDSYEQIQVPMAALGDQVPFLKDDMMVTAMVAGDEVLGYEIPAFGEYEVVQTDPAYKGDTVSGGSTKPATLESGAVIQVPFHIKEGETIKVDTRSGEYLERVKR
ncbi:MAG: elongation factor P [Fimbriimonadaceae bacterium]|nr:elongation factor P [Fimbriimonadaceae bacterium]